MAFIDLMVALGVGAEAAGVLGGAAVAGEAAGAGALAAEAGTAVAGEAGLIGGLGSTFAPMFTEAITPELSMLAELTGAPEAAGIFSDGLVGELGLNTLIGNSFQSLGGELGLNTLMGNAAGDTLGGAVAAPVASNIGTIPTTSLNTALGLGQPAAMSPAMGSMYAGAPAADVGWGEGLANGLGMTGKTAGYVGKGIEGAAYGMGLNGVTNLLSGKPVTQGMLQSGLMGGIGGIGSQYLGSMAGDTGIAGKIGKFAAENPNTTAQGIGALGNATISAMGTPAANPELIDQPSLPPGYRFNPNTYKQAYGHADGGEMHGSRGIADLGSYSDGGRLLKGPGDGVSDDIPAIIGHKQPARLAEGEFVIPARIVSELGNGSTDAGAKRLYLMMDRIQQGRHKTMGNKTQFANDTKAYKHLPA